MARDARVVSSTADGDLRNVRAPGLTALTGRLEPRCGVGGSVPDGG